MDILREVHRYVRDGVALMKARELVASQFSSKGKSKITSATIARWQAVVANQHIADWPALLLPRHAGRTVFTWMDAAMWMRFKTDFMRPECPTAASCYDRLKRTRLMRDKPIPSLKTFIRRIDEELPTWRQARLSGPRIRQMDLFK